MIDTLSKIGDNFYLKDRQPLLMKSGIVNKVIAARVDPLISVRLGEELKLKNFQFQKHL